MLPNISVTSMKIGKKTGSGQENFVFSKFEDLFLWLEKFDTKSTICSGVVLYGLAKDGRTGLRTRKENIEIKSDSRDYFLAREVAFEAGLIRKRGFGDVYVRTPQAGLAFARAMDSRFVVEAL